MQHTLAWRNGTLIPDLSQEALQETLNDPQAVVWLDIEDDPDRYADMFSQVFKLSHITIHTIGEKYERAKFYDGNGYFYVVVHGLVFDSKNEEASTPKLDIVFAQNFAHSPQVEHDNGYNFWIVLVVMALITIGQIWYFRRRGWLGNWHRRTEFYLEITGE